MFEKQRVFISSANLLRRILSKEHHDLFVLSSLKWEEGVIPMLHTCCWPWLGKTSPWNKGDTRLGIFCTLLSLILMDNYLHFMEEKVTLEETKSLELGHIASTGLGSAIKRNLAHSLWGGTLLWPPCSQVFGHPHLPALLTAPVSPWPDPSRPLLTPNHWPHRARACVEKASTPRRCALFARARWSLSRACVPCPLWWEEMSQGLFSPGALPEGRWFPLHSDGGAQRLEGPASLNVKVVVSSPRLGTLDC